VSATATAALEDAGARWRVAANDEVPSVAGYAWYRNYHRYYDPATGRYTQVDPLLARAPMRSRPLRRLHAYAYAGNQPVTRRDPRGLYIVADSQEVWEAIQEMQLDPNLGPLIDQLDRDPRPLTISRGDPEDLFRYGGAAAASLDQPGIEYDPCQARTTTMAALGLPSSIPTTIGHEVGHMYSWLVNGDPVGSTGSQAWALEFENALRPGELRIEHDVWPLTWPQCTWCE
jgi:RHS repeat-associated protein